MTQQNEPDAELLLSKQRGILPAHENEQHDEETPDREMRDNRDNLKRSEPD
ncbi:MAG TPA: hypothetical protein VGF98_01405 [Candidatus Tumulicola sp.]|jgi:hypothetical protein